MGKDGLDTGLRTFVEDDRSDALEARIRLETAHQDSSRHNQHAR